MTTSSGSPAFEIGPIRPPSEGGGNSLLLRVTRNCPWSRCTFCYGTLYHRNKFELRTVEDVKKDIDSAKAIADGIASVSWGLGYGGEANDVVGASMVRASPSLRSDQCFVTVFNWLYEGGLTAFLQDADSLIMRPGELEDVVAYLKSTFPSLERTTTYARAKSILRKDTEELRRLRAAGGLTRLHVGLETGDDELLELVDKGITSEQHIAAGRKAKEAGLELSQYIMPDLGGRARWEQHARNTARVLSAIDPDYIRFRSFVPRRGTPMYEDYEAGTFELSSPHERLREIRLLTQELTVNSHVCFDHFTNSWRNRSGGALFKRDYEGYRFPAEKQGVLDLIEEGLALDESAHVHAREMVHLTRM